VSSIDRNELSGLQLEAVWAAICEAFTSDELEQLLSFELEKKWAALVPKEKPFKAQVFELVQLSKREGWTDQLIRVVEKRRSGNRQVAKLRQTLGLVAPAAPPDTPEGAGYVRFEREVKAGGRFVEFAKLAEIQARMCRVETSTALGTGFLVSSDLVLTNYHVVEQEILAPAGSKPEITCIFEDTATAAGGTIGIKEGVADDWRYAYSPYAPHELDFALLRLARPIGEVVVNGRIRGWIDIKSKAPLPEPESVVLIIQYPRGGPLASSLGTVRGSDQSRIHYSASTERGSSGSPVFSADLSLVALHHAGDPDWSHPAEYNQGILIGPIVRNLEEKGLWPPKKAEKPDAPSPRDSDDHTDTPRERPGLICILGEPKLPAPAAAAAQIAKLSKDLAERGASVETFEDGWRDQPSLTPDNAGQFLQQRPVFIRTVVTAATVFRKEMEDLNYKLHRRFGLDLDDSSELRSQLMRCSRVLWRPGDPWTDAASARPPEYAQSSGPVELGKWLADLLGLAGGRFETVIHCEYPWDDHDVLKPGWSKPWAMIPSPIVGSLHRAVCLISLNWSRMKLHKMSLYAYLP
jgi:V8-like Glu-specific endopeptidase